MKALTGIQMILQHHKHPVLQIIYSLILLRSERNSQKKKKNTFKTLLYEKLQYQYLRTWMGQQTAEDEAQQ